MDTPIRVLLVGEVAALQPTVEQLQSTPDAFAAPLVVSPDSACEALAGPPVDVIVLDLPETIAEGAATLNRLRVCAPTLPILVLANAVDDEIAIAALQNGAEDYLVKGHREGPDLSRLIRSAIERKRVARSFRESEEFFRAISENLTELIAVIGPDGRRLYNSPSYRAVLGNPSLLVGTDSFEEIHPEDRPRVRAIFHETMVTGVGREAEFRFLLRDGRVRHIESRASVIQGEQGQPARLLVVSRDVTERKLAEADLREREEFFRLISDNMSDLVAVIDRDGRRLYNSPSYRAVFGDHDPALGSDSFAEIHPEDQARIRQVFRETLATGLGQRVIYRFLLKNGTERHVESLGSVIRDETGQVAKVVVVSRDITERQRSMQALRESQERFELVLRGSNDGIWDWNVLTNEVYFSPQWKAMLGYADHEIGNTFAAWEQLLHPDDRTRALATVQDYFSGQSPTYELEHRLRHKDGNYRWILARGVALRDPSGRPVRMGGSHVDLTERKAAEERLKAINERLEQREEELRLTIARLSQANEALNAAQFQLLQAARLELVGTLAAGVAHQVKNPLQTILLGLEYLTGTDAGKNPNVAAVLQDMTDAVRRADSTVREMLQFSSANQATMAARDLNGVVEDAARLVNYELQRNRVNLVRDLEPGLPLVRLDNNKIEQALVNLFINALHAMPDGGTLTVRTRRAARLTHETGVQRVMIQVEDTGTGIPAENLDKIFDTFFTTKPPGIGTGLGLNVTKRIIELHGGSIQIENRSEGGVRATLLLKVGASH